MHTSTHAYTDTHTHTYTCARTHAHKHSRAHTYTCARTHAQTNAYINPPIPNVNAKECKELILQKTGWASQV